MRQGGQTLGQFGDSYLCFKSLFRIVSFSEKVSSEILQEGHLSTPLGHSAIRFTVVHSAVGHWGGNSCHPSLPRSMVCSAPHPGVPLWPHREIHWSVSPCGSGRVDSGGRRGRLLPESFLEEEKALRLTWKDRVVLRSGKAAEVTLRREWDSICVPGCARMGHKPIA